MPKPLVLLAQLPIPPLGFEPVCGNVPLAAGYLKLWARRNGLERDFDIDIVDAAMANLFGDALIARTIAEREPEVLGLTVYLWNIDRSLRLAREVKKISPRTRVFLGGPEITADNAWVLEGEGWDYAAVGEGEQTFGEFLRAWSRGERESAVIAGLIRRAARGAPFQPRAPMAILDPISSPYTEGILSAADQEHLLLETIRGCIFKCRFCYYPKAYDGLYYVGRERILANLAHAREHGAKEVFLLDPTLNQRKDFKDFLKLLIEGNPDRRLEYHAELRAEGIGPEEARLMRQANFKNVEIGLQSIDPQTQELMERRNNLRAFEKGVRALKDEGVTTKIDLIVGLPGDTEDSIRRGIDYVASNRLYDEIQVFQLSVLPGTEFRAGAASYGLEFQDRPPYYVTKTKTLDAETMLRLLDEAEDAFDVDFDPLPDPVTAPLADEAGAVRSAVLDLDDPDAAVLDAAIPLMAAQSFGLFLRAKDPWARLGRAEAAIRALLDKNPFMTLQVAIATAGEFPLDVIDRLRTACRRPENIYLDRFYEFTTARGAGAQRLVARIMRRHEVDADWLVALESSCEVYDD